VKSPVFAPLTKKPPTKKSAGLAMIGELAADPSSWPSTSIW